MYYLLHTYWICQELHKWIHVSQRLDFISFEKNNLSTIWSFAPPYGNVCRSVRLLFLFSCVFILMESIWNAFEWCVDLFMGLFICYRFKIKIFQMQEINKNIKRFLVVVFLLTVYCFLCLFLFILFLLYGM